MPTGEVSEYGYAYTATYDEDGKKASAPVDAEGNWKVTFPETFAYNTEPQDLTITSADGDNNDVHGPVLRDVIYETDCNKAYIKMDYVGAGLTTTDKSGHVKGIEVLLNVNGTLQWSKHEGKIIT